MSVEEALNILIKPSLEKMKVIILGEYIPEVKNILPNAEIKCITNQIDTICKEETESIKYVIDNGELFSIKYLKIISFVYKIIEFDGALISVFSANGMDNALWVYSEWAKYASFKEMLVATADDPFIVRVNKYKTVVIELKGCYTHEIRKKLSCLLRRIEYNIDIEENVVELALLCEEHTIDKEYLNKFIDNTIINKENLLANIQGNYKVDLNKRVKDILHKEQYSFDKKIAFVMCVNDEDMYSEAVRYIKQLKIPGGYGVEILPIRGAKSICEGYNQAIKKSTAKYKVYLHQDCMILNENFIQNILDIFVDNSIGCIGIIGCDKLTASGIWWQGQTKIGTVYHATQVEYCEPTIYKNPVDLYEDAEAVDGLLIVTQYDVRWREDIFTGWHFYDNSVCQEMKRHGFKTVIPRQDTPWTLHCASDKPLNEDYDNYQKVFLKEYMK